LTKTTECSQTRSLLPTSLTHLISLVEAGSVPTLADAAILAIDRDRPIRPAGQFRPTGPGEGPMDSPFRIEYLDAERMLPVLVRKAA
jgi:hypothetical protein